MQILGLDLARRHVTGVAVDGEGRVLRRARREGEPGEIASLVLSDLRHEPQASLGVASETDGGAMRDHDARFTHRVAAGAAAVAAEAWVGAARGAKHAVCLWIGHRVTAGILLNGEPWLGAHGMAGAAAWLALNPVERQDYRKYGSLAAEISARGIARRMTWRIQAGDHSAVLERAGDLDAITATHVFDGARSGDGVAIAVVRDTARYLGMAVANLVTAVDPEVIVIGGPIAAAGDLLLDPVRQETARRIPPMLASQLRVEVSPLAEDGIAIGAASLALKARHTS